LPNWVSVAAGRSFIKAEDSRSVLALALCVSLAACADDVEWIDARIEIHRPTATTCRLDEDATLTAYALGDFPPSGRTVAAFDPRDGTLALERFPVDTRYLRVVHGSPEDEAGVAIKLSSRAPSQRALLLPLGRSCPSPDFEARARVGAAVAALPDGSLLIAGGRNDDLGDQADGAAVSTAFVLPAGRELAEQVEGGMFLRRSGATATVVGDRVLVIGGGPHDRGPAHDTFETFDVGTRSFSVNTGTSLVHGPRRDHAAIALADGSGALIVGGVSELGSAPLSTAEVVTAAGARDVPGLSVGRSQPALHVLSDGRVLIVGGTDANNSVTVAVEFFDPETNRIQPLDVTFATAERAVSASLVGDRVAWLGCGAVGCSVSVLQSVDSVERVIASPVTLPSLTRAQVIGLSDGALLVVGQRRLSDLAEAWRVDVGASVVTEVDASRVTTTLRVLADGTVAELDETGLSLRRDRIVTPFDNPPATLLPDDPELAIDVAAHWNRESDRLVAQVDDARLDVASLVFGSFVVTLDVEVPAMAQATLRLNGGSLPTDVTISESTVSVGACEVARASSSDAVTVERHGDQLTLHGGDTLARCSAALPEHVSLSLTATRNGAIGPINVVRR